VDGSSRMLPSSRQIVGEGEFDPKRRYKRCVAGARRAPVDEGGAWHAERKLRDIA
jgi:hypothetical protein